MRRAFIDTNVLLEVLVRRKPFWDDSAAVWALCETGKIEGIVSSLSLPNVFYVICRAADVKTARRAIVILRDIFTIVPLDAQLINQAIDAGGDDFEDAIQFFSALRAGVSVLITRNTRHFPAGELAVQTPAEFLASRGSPKR